MNLYELTAHQLSDKLKAKEISSTEITKSVIKRIENVEKKVESYITTTYDLALETAKKVDEKIAKGEEIAPLEGIPMAIKDNICTKGIPTTCASKILKNFKPPYNATAYEKLFCADAILLGKLNMDEFGMGSTTENSAFKLTKNPYDLTKVPGGSSGGSAASVAANEAFFSLGSDTGGSIRQPAALCGCVGLKPTYGTVSRYGLVAFSSSLEQIGPITKDVRDAAIVLNVIAGYDKMDSTSSTFKHPDFEASLTGNIKGVKIGIPKEFIPSDINPEVLSSFKTAINNLSAAGASYYDTSFPLNDYALPVYYIISSVEASSNLSRFDGIKYGYCTKNFSNLHELYSKTRSKGFGQEVKSRIMLGTFALTSERCRDYYDKALKIRRMISDEFSKKFSDFDVLVTPAYYDTAHNFGEGSHDPTKMYKSSVLNVAVNIAGLPAIVVPCGYDKAGLPIGIQIIGKPFSESTILNVAYTLEKTITKCPPRL